jgi:hypothetical protein
LRSICGWNQLPTFPVWCCFRCNFQEHYSSRGCDSRQARSKRHQVVSLDCSRSIGFLECSFADPSSRLVCSESEFIGCDAAAAAVIAVRIRDDPLLGPLHCQRLFGSLRLLSRHLHHSYFPEHHVSFFFICRNETSTSSASSGSQQTLPADLPQSCFQCHYHLRMSMTGCFLLGTGSLSS